MTANLQAKFNEALAHHQAGRLADAEKMYRDILQADPRNAHALHLLGVIASQVGRFDVAVDLIHKAIAQNAQIPIFQNSLGNALKGQGKLAEAITAYRRATARQPDSAANHENLGIALAEHGDMAEAIAEFERALALQPHAAVARSNLGSLLMEQGRVDEAIACFQQALLDRPDLAETHNILGSAYVAQGRLQEAAAAFRQALTLKPDFVLAACSLALLFSGAGRHGDALAIMKQVLEHTDSIQAKKTFAACTKHMRWRDSEPEFRTLMTRAVEEGWGRPSELAHSAIDLLLSHSEYYVGVAHVARQWPARLSLQDLRGAEWFAHMAADPLLMALLTSTPLCHMGLERILISARHALLDLVESSTSAQEHEVFFSALARQCFINEYVYPIEPVELNKALALREKLSSTLNAGETVSANLLVAVAAYFPLSTVATSAQLLSLSWPPHVSALLDQHIREPQLELEEKKNIARLTDIENQTSILVRHQYEECPYPRWIRTPIVDKSQNFGRYLAHKFPLAHFDRTAVNGAVSVLCAGCGTGQQAIETAQRVESSQILAVDLSLNSLGYARRKARELGIEKIEFAQADILTLERIGKSFDVIESVGVLHHLADPWAGWRGLLPLLRPGGFMQIGLYSEIGRREIVVIRELIARKGYGNSVDEIRRFRQDLVDFDTEGSFGKAIGAMDFYSMSMCRDLLFHVQEHRLTLSGIHEFLRDNHLIFVGFDIDHDTLSAYRRSFPEDPAATNLLQWQIFENNQPATFGEMYNFWVQKPVAI